MSCFPAIVTSERSFLMIDPEQGFSVLVTGGTGFLGQYVVGSLLETGYAVRDCSSARDEKGKGKIRMSFCLNR